MQPKILPRNARGGFKPNSLIIQLIWTLRTVARRLSCNSTYMPEEALKALRRWTDNRRLVCREELKVSDSHGKKVVTAWLSGGTPDKSFKDIPFARNIRRASIYLRWLACSAWPKITKNWRQEATSRIQERQHSSTCGRAWKMLCWKPGLTSCF